MFDNVGKKIKGLASIFFVIELLGNIIFGIVLMAFGGSGAILGLVVIAVGSLMSWASCLALYGFGEAVENSSITVRNTQIILSTLNSLNSTSTSGDRNVQTSSTSTSISANNEAYLEYYNTPRAKFLRTDSSILEELTPSQRQKLSLSDKIRLVNIAQDYSEGKITEQEYNTMKAEIICKL